jgi:hypothetical protein
MTSRLIEAPEGFSQVYGNSEAALIPEQVRQLDKYLPTVIDKVVARAQQAIKALTGKAWQTVADPQQPWIKVL